jgi:hypothetical protein
MNFLNYFPPKLLVTYGNHTIPCIFHGYSEEPKAYCLMSKDNRKIIISRDVTFDEKLSLATCTQVPWYIDEDTKKDSFFSMSFLTPLIVSTVQHGLQQQAIIASIFQLHIYHQILV